MKTTKCKKLQTKKLTLKKSPRRSITSQISDKLGHIQIKLENIDTKLQEHDEKFEIIDRKFDLIDKRFDLIDQKFEIIDNRFNNITENFSLIDKRFDNVDLQFSNHLSDHRKLAEQREKRKQIVKSILKYSWRYGRIVIPALLAGTGIVELIKIL